MILFTVISSILKAGMTDMATGWRPSRWTFAMAPLAMVIATSAFVLSGGAEAQQPNPATPLDRMEFLIGRWEGTSEGQPGRGTVQREYTRALNSRFIRVQNRNVYPRQEKNPKGEIHQDEGWFSFDRSRNRLVLRQFHGEGFVNQYVEESDPSPTKFVFTTEAIENIPAGWRARETYIVHGPDEFEEVFELAEPGKPFELYSRARLKRLN